MATEQPDPKTRNDRPHSLESTGLPDDLRAYLDAIEREAVLAALDINHGHQKQAADQLGLSYDQLRGILRKFDISPRGRHRPD